MLKILQDIQAAHLVIVEISSDLPPVAEIESMDTIYRNPEDNSEANIEFNRPII